MSAMKSMFACCIVAILGVGAYFLFPQAFAGTSWPLLLLLLVCPLGMMFMAHGEKKSPDAPSSSDVPTKK